MEEYFLEYLEIESDGLNQLINVLNDEVDDVEDIEKDDDDEVFCGIQGGGVVLFICVKCVVFMIILRDVCVYGVIDCLFFVEFDMSVDGFGCLFLLVIVL